MIKKEDYVCPQCGPDPRGAEAHALARHTVLSADPTVYIPALEELGYTVTPPKVDPIIEAASLIVRQMEKHGSDFAIDPAAAATWPGGLDEWETVQAANASQLTSSGFEKKAAMHDHWVVTRRLVLEQVATLINIDARGA